MRFVLIALAASVAAGQSNSVFQLTRNQTRQELEQIATVLRMIADLPQVSIDDTKKTLAAAGTPGQIAMAGWLVRQLDLPANGQLSGAREYRPPDGSDDVVRVFYATHASTLPDVQQIATTIRSLADIRRVSIYTPVSGLAVRGTGQQVSLAAFLMEGLNQPANLAAPAPHEYRLPGDDVTRIFELSYPQTPQELQEITTLIRSIGDIQRVFVYSSRRTVALRAKAEQVSLAAWLVSELDRPPNALTATQDAAAAHEYRLSSGPDNLVRVFYLRGAQSVQEHQHVATQVRITARIPRLFVYNALGALAVRGTVGQVATAERLIEEMKAQ